MAFQSKEGWRFPFWNIFFRFRDIYVFVLCHGNSMVGAAGFVSFAIYILKITASIFLEIFLVQYFIVLVELFMTSSHSSVA